MNNESKLTTGEKLKDLRKKAGLTSEQLCIEIEKRYGYIITKSKYNEIENDKDKDFGFKSFLYLAKFYNVSTDYLLGRTPHSTIDEDDQNVLKVTGLSEKALENIKVLCGTSPTTWTNLSRKAVMFMLESEHLTEIARALGYTDTYNKVLDPSPELTMKLFKYADTDNRNNIEYLALSAISQTGFEDFIINSMKKAVNQIYNDYRKELENGKH